MKGNVFFIGDTHFGHKMILQYEPEHRPFATIEEHDAEIIKRWNSVVTPKDKVYHLGDVVFGKANLPKIGELNGDKILIMGNHDCYGVDEYKKYFRKIFGVTFYKEFILSHVPVHPGHARALANIHGHLHSNIVMSNEIVAPDKKYPMSWCMMPDKNYFNVSCEQINLTPISLDEIYLKWYRESQ